MATKSKFFRVAVEGATTDRRTIDRAWIEQMAKNFDPKKYGARVWMEHIRGLYPDSDFRAYGDVIALEAREETEGEFAGKLALYAQIDPTADLIALSKKRQKIYTSIEIDENFADSGEAYLIGLGITDSPASLGTEVLKFAAQNPAASPFASRKQKPENLFSAGVETHIEFVEDDDAPPPTLGKKVKELIAKFSKQSAKEDSRFAEVSEALDGIATVVEQALERVNDAQKSFAARTDIERLSKEMSELKTSFESFKEQMDQEPDGKQSFRPAATGGTAQLTDC